MHQMTCAERCIAVPLHVVLRPINESQAVERHAGLAGLCVNGGDNDIYNLCYIDVHEIS